MTSEQLAALDDEGAAKRALPVKPVAWAWSRNPEDFWQLLSEVASSEHLQRLVGWAGGLHDQELRLLTRFAEALSDTAEDEGAIEGVDYHAALYAELGAILMGTIAADAKVRRRSFTSFEAWMKAEADDLRIRQRRNTLWNKHEKS